MNDHHFAETITAALIINEMKKRWQIPHKIEDKAG